MGSSRICTKCEKSKRDTEFYVSYSPLHNGKIPYCKTCIRNQIDVENVESIKDTLRMIDRPYLHFLWQTSVEEAKEAAKEPFGILMKNLGMKQYRELTWENSIFAGDVPILTESTESIIDNIEQLKPDLEMIKKWGKNFEPEDYYKLEDFYIKMMDANKIETPQEETYLKKLSVISLKMDKELEAGNYAQVKQLGDLFSKYMADSKFRAMDQSDASKTGGIRTFSQIYAEVEKDDYIPPWEEYRKVKGLKQDIIDKTIMYILNYTLKLNKVSQLTSPPSDTPHLDEDESNE